MKLLTVNEARFFQKTPKHRHCSECTKFSLFHYDIKISVYKLIF